MTGDDHNFATMALDDRAALELESALEGPRARWAELSAAVEGAPATIGTETQAENFTTVVGQLQALLKRVDAAHDDVKEPYLNAGRRVDGATFVLREKISDAKELLQLRITAYQTGKQRKIEEERAALRKQEAEDPEPTVVPFEEMDRRRSRIRSVEGASAHLVPVVEVEIVDITKIPLRYLTRPRVIQALKTEILPDVRKGDVVEGVKKITDLQSRVKT